MPSKKSTKRSTLKSRAQARKQRMTAKLQVGSYDTTDFDLDFWQRATPEERFIAVFELVAHAEAVKKERGDDPVRFGGFFTLLKPGKG
jgi:hypothetical protein